MKTNTCGECRYYGDTTPYADCHANPPVIIDAFVNPKDDDSLLCASVRPVVWEGNVACRFFYHVRSEQ